MCRISTCKQRTEKYLIKRQNINHIKHINSYTKTIFALVGGKKIKIKMHLKLYLPPPSLSKVRLGEKKVRSERGVCLRQGRALDKGGGGVT